MSLLSCQYYNQWRLLDILVLARPDTARGCATLEFNVVRTNEIVVQDVHGRFREELSSTMSIPWGHLSLPITQSPTLGDFGWTILENLNEGFGMDHAASQYFLWEILGARNHAAREHATTGGFDIEVYLELVTTDDVVIDDDGDDDLQPHRPRGASEATKQKLDAGSFFLAAGDQEAGTCAICLEDLSSGRGDNRGRVTKMPCAHVFHNPCVLRWLDTSTTCPMCRRELED